MNGSKQSDAVYPFNGHLKDLHTMFDLQGVLMLLHKKMKIRVCTICIIVYSVVDVIAGESDAEESCDEPDSTEEAERSEIDEVKEDIPPIETKPAISVRAEASTSRRSSASTSNSATSSPRVPVPPRAVKSPMPRPPSARVEALV